MKLKSLSVLGSRMFMYRFFKLFPKWQQFETKYMKDCSLVIHEFHKDFIAAVAEERYGVELPLDLGKMYVISYKSKPRVDLTRFNTTGEITRFTNNHTDGYACKIVYDNRDRRYRFKDKRIWNFAPEAKFKKAVSKAFAQDHVKYIFSSDKKKSYYDKLSYDHRDANKERIEKFLVTYDEFEMN